MTKECDEYSTDDSEEDDNCEDVNWKLLDDGSGYQKSDTFVHIRLDYEAIGQKYEIQPDQLLIVKPLGQGYYSDVHMGMLSLPNAKIPVAVKTPKTITGSINVMVHEDILRRQRDALRDELNMFAYLQSSPKGGHENVLKLVGAITTIKTDFCILTEYCECGSLDLFLQKKWKNGEFENELILEGSENDEVWKIQHEPSWGENFQERRDNGIITTSDLLWFALQIARAMQFLADKKVLHRDVALRNVLLKSDYTIKVADFGLSRKLKGCEDTYYVWKRGTPLPIRYIAPESLKSGRSSLTSEYWSFGVVIWELFTFAEKQPYSVEFENYESKQKFHDFLIQYLSSGYRIPIPHTVPKLTKELLSKLWDSDPKQRPSFQACEKVIEQELMQSCPNMLKGETVFIHPSGYGIFHAGHNDSLLGTTENQEYTLLDSSVSPYRVRGTISTRNSVKWTQQKTGRIVISVGILLVILIATAITLNFTVFGKMPPIRNHPRYIIERLSQVTTPKFGNTKEQKVLDDKLRLESWEWGWSRIRQYELAAEEGNAVAQNILGVLYYFGKGVYHQSYEDAFKWFNKSAEQGYSNALFNLGVMYQNGLGVNQSDVEASRWYKIAAEKGNADAQNSLGVMYYWGKGMNRRDIEAALGWYRMAAEQGNAEAQNNLGVMYKNGLSVDQSNGEAEIWYKQALTQGNKEADFNLELMYLNGGNVLQLQDDIQTLQNAETGNVSAQLTLAAMYQTNSNVKQSEQKAAKWYAKAAEQGSASAQYNLGVMLYNGKGVGQSQEEAFKWYRKAAEQGHAKAQFNLGFMTEYGLGVHQSYAEAIKWYTKAAEQGHVDAQYNLGVIYYDGKGINQSYEEAAKWYRKAAEQGNAAGQNKLGLMYQYGWGVDKSYEEAIKWYKRAAEQGDANGQNKLAIMYLNGWGVEKSYEEALKWFKKAAEQGDADGQNNLGDMYYYGRSVEPSYEEAEKWYVKAAEQENAAGQNGLGVLYMYGWGVERSYEEAVKWFRKSAEQGLVNAQRNLGAMYFHGSGVNKSDEEAVKWFRKAAEQGYAGGQGWLGYMYLTGSGVNKSFEEAFKWNIKAAEQGDANGQNSLGYMYLTGSGVDKSYEEALKWYSKAADHGDDEARKMVEFLKNIKK